ncbi:MAG TPA: hypothetical protein PLG23_13500 [Thermoflexales bacterium]|jgi:hypothetical protein|nr:hypothetical protein [Thermoflexales bacterium]HQZ54480.1 hypothetical protein [Thermoflexales bacterium]HRA53812.1 hypothetical protein [Thermoflexales bacterium]
MNIFNKIFAIVTLIIGFVTGLIAILFPQTALAAINGLAAGFHTSFFPGTDGLARVAARAPLAITFALLVGGLLYLELRKPRSSTIEVSKATGGKVRVTTASVEKKLLDGVNAMPDVISAKVRVSTRGPSLTAYIEAVTPDTVDVLAKGDEIAAGVRAIAQDQLGLKMQDKPHVMIKPTKVKAPSPAGRALFGSKKRAGGDDSPGRSGR